MLRFAVWGEPAPNNGGTGRRGERKWREAIEAKVRVVRDENHSQVSKSTHFRVSIVFLINEPKLSKYEYGSDLDNMAKSVIDTLFRTGKSGTDNTLPTGVLFPIDDKQVFELALKKKFPGKNGKEGAIITVSWD